MVVGVSQRNACREWQDTVVTAGEGWSGGRRSDAISIKSSLPARMRNS